MPAKEKNVSKEVVKTQVKPDGKVSSAGWKPDVMLLQIFLLVTCVKILLIPTYHSTDFEVHRNWLAITHSLPLKEWYVNTQSPWTLDYPPLFAWFEYYLSQIAVFFDPEMVKVENLNYASAETVYFQRGTVIFADLMFAYGVRETGKTFCKFSNYTIFALLSLCNIGLLIVDHIHFQYNGFLLGILLVSMANVSKIGEQISILQGAAWFAILLNLKHLYLYVAPAYIIWLLKSYLLNGGKFIKRLFELGLIVLTVLVISFGPFRTQLPEVISRLFPFKRGLVHSYWAANGWALYIALEKILSVMWKHLELLKDAKSAVMTGGLVQEQEFLILPTPTPIVTFLLTFLAIFPALWCLSFKKPYMNSKYFLRCIVLCALGSFMFGWHVHEKAILTAIIPLCILAVVDAEDARIFIILSSAGHTALLPLLYPDNLFLLKLTLSLTYMFTAIIALSKLHSKLLLRLHEWLYVIPLPLITIYETLLHKFLFNDRLPFLPLAFTSIYCAIGITYSWILYYWIYMRNNDKMINNKPKRKRLKSKRS